MTARDFSTLAEARASLAVAGQTISAKMRENAALRREISQLRTINADLTQDNDTLRQRIEDLECALLSAGVAA